MALIFGGGAQIATRGEGSMDLPEASLGAMLLVGVPLLAAWWFLGAFVGIPISRLTTAWLIWFVGGALLLRISSRLLSAYVTRNRFAEDGSSEAPSVLS
jgi:hypothetical protein